MIISERQECKPPILLLPSTLLKLHKLLEFLPPGQSRESSKISTTREKLLYEEGPLFCGIKVRAETLTLVLPTKKGEILQKRFRNALVNENGDGSELTYSKHR